jgi:hypothetical protein
MAHICQELALRPVGEFGCLSRLRVLRYGLSQCVYHLIDLGLERIHFSAGLDRDEFGEVSVGCRGRNLSKGSHLTCQVGSHGVYVRANGSRVIDILADKQERSSTLDEDLRDLFPHPLDVLHLSLYTEFSFKTHLLGYPDYLRRERSKRIYHAVDVDFKQLNFPMYHNIDPVETTRMVSQLSDSNTGSASQTYFCERSPRAIALVTVAIPLTWVVRFPAIKLTLSSRSFHSPKASGTTA